MHRVKVTSQAFMNQLTLSFGGRGALLGFDLHYGTVLLFECDVERL